MTKKGTPLKMSVLEHTKMKNDTNNLFNHNCQVDLAISAVLI